MRVLAEKYHCSSRNDRTRYENAASNGINVCRKYTSPSFISSTLANPASNIVWRVSCFGAAAIRDFWTVATEHPLNRPIRAISPENNSSGCGSTRMDHIVQSLGRQNRRCAKHLEHPYHYLEGAFRLRNADGQVGPFVSVRIRVFKMLAIDDAKVVGNQT